MLETTMAESKIMPMKCPECGWEISQPSISCPHCGAPRHTKKRMRFWLSNRFRRLFLKHPGNKKQPGIFQAEVIIWWSALLLPVSLLAIILMFLPTMKRGLDIFTLPLIALRLIFLGIAILVIIIFAFVIRRILRQNE